MTLHIFAWKFTNWFDMLSSACSNVFKLLAQRELSPQTKRTPKRFWGKASSCHDKSSGMKSGLAKDARQELRSWYLLFLCILYDILTIVYAILKSNWSFKLYLNHRGEAESLLHLSANYCPLLPPPRSTIAAAFSPDGKTLASTQLVSLSLLSYIYAYVKLLCIF